MASEGCGVSARFDVDREAELEDRIFQLEDRVCDMEGELERARSENSGLYRKAQGHRQYTKNLRARIGALKEENRRLGDALTAAVVEPNARALIEELTEENRQLRQVVKPHEGMSLPTATTPSEAKVIALLFSKESVSHDAIFNVIQHKKDDHTQPPADQSAAIIYRIRRKLAPLGIKIESIPGWGYRIPKESKETYGRLSASGPGIHLNGAAG
jgi:hypothetical protein